ncbi:MAG: hypothetical protein JSU63_13870 [Phycisphaerales bacterium]|nr:MAG: hypothetical protein JSU63_13870 [Phycisphaerales bacterium]
MKPALFYSFLIIFILTAILTLAGVAGYVQIRETYLDALFASLLLELVAAVVTLFVKARFFDRPESGEDSTDITKPDTPHTVGQRTAEATGGAVDPTASEGMPDQDIFDHMPETTKSVRVLAISSIQSVMNAPLRRLLRGQQLIELRWLVLNPESPAVVEYARNHPHRTAEEVRNHIRAAVDRLLGVKTMAGVSHLKIRMYDDFPVFRLVFFDGSVYVRYYPRREPWTRHSSALFRENEGWMYNAMETYFESVWERAKEYPVLGEGTRKETSVEAEVS